MVYAVRKKNESADRLINRFKKQVQHSRVLMKARNERYNKKDPSKRHSRQAAVMRGVHRNKKKKLVYYEYNQRQNERKTVA